MTDTLLPLTEETLSVEVKGSKSQRFYYRHREEIIARKRAIRAADPVLQQKRAEREAAKAARDAEKAAAKKAKEEMKREAAEMRAKQRFAALGLDATGGVRTKD